MSALNCFVTPSEVHVFTDGGNYDPDTITLRGTGNKIASLPQYNCVIAGMGLVFIPKLISALIEENGPATFDTIAADFPTLVEDYIPKAAARFGLPSNWGQFELILAGWSSSKNEPFAYHLCGYEKDGWPAFRYMEVTRFRAPDDLEFINFEFDPDNASASGLQLMQMQRNTKMDVPSAPTRAADGNFVVHGFCQHTSIDNSGIHMRVLEHWHDQP